MIWDPPQNSELSHIPHKISQTKVTNIKSVQQPSLTFDIFVCEAQRTLLKWLWQNLMQAKLPQNLFPWDEGKGAMHRHPR